MRSYGTQTGIASTLLFRKTFLTEKIQKIQKNWRAVITDQDTVIIPGDISWALKLEDAAEDLCFLDSLPGKKLIGKGNHDFWWATVTKMNSFFEANNIQTVQILYNNAYRMEDCIVCGTRGWFLEEGQQHTVGKGDYSRIVNRELIRLRMSLEAVQRLQEKDTPLPILVFLHFPPVWNGFVCREIVDLLHEFNIRSCYYGHIHGAYYTPGTSTFEGIDFTLTAADYLNFIPMPINPGQNTTYE